MKQFKVIILLFTSLFLAVFSYLKGLENTDYGCGSCADLGRFPNTTAFYLLPQYRKVNQVSLEFCDVVRCSAPRVPLYVDLYGLSGIMFLLAVSIYFRSNDKYI